MSEASSCHVEPWYKGQQCYCGKVVISFPPATTNYWQLLHWIVVVTMYLTCAIGTSWYGNVACTWLVRIREWRRNTTTTNHTHHMGHIAHHHTLHPFLMITFLHVPLLQLCLKFHPLQIPFFCYLFHFYQEGYELWWHLRSLAFSPYIPDLSIVVIHVASTISYAGKK